MAVRLGLPAYSTIDTNGDPVSGALLHTYAIGTSTPLPTYTTDALTIANQNPVVADSAGRFPDIFLSDNDYKFVLQDANGVTIVVWDSLGNESGTTTVPTPGDGVESNFYEIGIVEGDVTEAANNWTTLNSYLADGATFRIPAGNWYFTKWDVSESGVFFIGSSERATQIIFTTTADHAFTNSGDDGAGDFKDEVVVQDLTLTYSGAGQASGKHGVYAVAPISLKQVTVSSFTNDNIHLDDVSVSEACAQSVFHNVSSMDAGNNGLTITSTGASTPRFLYFYGCRFSQNTGKGVEIDAGHGYTFSGGVIGSNTANGLVVDAAYGVQFHGVGIHGNGTKDVEIGTTTTVDGSFFNIPVTTGQSGSEILVTTTSETVVVHDGVDYGSTSIYGYGLTKVSSNDTTGGYLNGKLVAGTNVTFVEGSDGGDETLTINGQSGGSTPFRILEDDYGAVGDGVTDDYQAFIDAAAAGGVVICKSASYAVDTTMDLGPSTGIDTHFLGINPGGTGRVKIICDVAGGHGIVMTSNGTQHQTFENFWIDNIATQTGGNHLVVIENGGGLVNCLIEDATNTAVQYIDNPATANRSRIGLRMRDCHIETSNTGIDINNTTSEGFIDIDNVTVDSCQEGVIVTLDHSGTYHWPVRVEGLRVTGCNGTQLNLVSGDYMAFKNIMLDNQGSYNPDENLIIAANVFHSIIEINQAVSDAKWDVGSMDSTNTLTIEGQQFGAGLYDDTSTAFSFDWGMVGKTILANNASAIAATIEPDSTDDFPLGTQFEIVQKGAGAVTATAGAGVTINAPNGAATTAQWERLRCQKTAADTWVVDLVSVGSGGGGSLTVGNGLSATGTTQGGALALTADWNQVTTITASSAEAVVLPTAAADSIITIKNDDSADDLVIFPASGDDINGGSTDASISLSPGATITLICDDTASWTGEPDFEAGTWTPNLEFGGASVGMTYSDQEGWYYKIGRLVFIRIDIVLTAKGTSTGSATITGLPFTTAADYPPGGGMVEFTGNLNSMVGATSARLAQNNTYAILNEHASSGATAIDDTNFSNTSQVRFTLTYEAA